MDATRSGSCNTLSSRLFKAPLWPVVGALRLPKRLTERGSVDSASRRVEFEWPGGGRLVCVDPSYGTKNGAVPLVPFVVEGRVVGWTS
jgi:hypothetical protein